jgi:hypothetical protein
VKIAFRCLLIKQYEKFWNNLLANVELFLNTSANAFSEISSFKMLYVLRRSMIEKYFNKSIDDKRLISIKSNLIYWSECWLFDVLQLTSIEIYLYSTIYEMKNFDVELDSYLSRSHVVKWISRNEILRESFSKTFVLRSFAHFVTRSLRIWAWSLNRWVRLIEDLTEIIEQALLDLRETMRWLDVTYSYSKRRRNMILLLKIIVSVIKQWIHWIWKTFFYWILLSNELLAWFFEFSLIVNLLIQSFKMKTSLRVRIRDEKTSWRSRLSFTTVNVFFHARNHAFLMREMLVFRIIHREDDHFDRFRIQIEFFVWFFLKFIESDRLSWMRNVVDNKWWMRKWVVKKTKMRCKEVFRLKRRFLFLRSWLNFFFVSSFNFATFSVDFFCLLKKRIFFEAFVMSFVWDSSSTDLNIIKSDKSLSKFLKIVLEKNSKSKCCQKCIKFLVENSFFKCVFDVNRFVCNRCERLNAVCMIVWISSICRWRVDD